MLSNPNEFWFSFLAFELTARGDVAFIMAVSVSVLIVALAWLLVRRPPHRAEPQNRLSPEQTPAITPRERHKV